MSCLFCNIVDGSANSYKIFENDNVVAFLDIFPQEAGHVLVIPKTHCENIMDFNLEFDYIAEIQKVIEVMKNVLGDCDIKIIQNNGTRADQVVMHMHFHLIPKYSKGNKYIDYNVEKIYDLFKK